MGQYQYSTTYTHHPRGNGQLLERETLPRLGITGGTPPLSYMLHGGRRNNITRVYPKYSGLTL
jgi:hypothetical protein